MLSLSKHHRKDLLTISPLVNWSHITVYTVCHNTCNLN